MNNFVKQKDPLHDMSLVPFFSLDNLYFSDCYGQSYDHCFIYAESSPLIYKGNSVTDLHMIESFTLRIKTAFPV